MTLDYNFFIFYFARSMITTVMNHYLIHSSRFVVNQRGGGVVSNVFLMYVWLNQWGSMKNWGWVERHQGGGGKPPPQPHPPTNRALLIQSNEYKINNYRIILLQCIYSALRLQATRSSPTNKYHIFSFPVIDPNNDGKIFLISAFQKSCCPKWL